MAEQTFSVTAEESHERLDVILARRLSISRSQTRKLLEEGCVSLDGVAVGRSVKGVALEAGSEISVRDFVHPVDRQALPEPDAPLSILAEGPGWLAVDKPAGSPVHPLEPDETGTVLNALIARRPEIQGIGEGGLRSGVLHRLDVDTSGALLFATTADAFAQLREAFASHAIEKTYHALVSGAPDDEGRLDLRLRVAQHRPAFVKVAESHGGRATRMRYRVLEHFARASLVEVALETGFLHQIRVGFAHLGHPVLGDAVYGDAAAPAAPRQMLHCARLVYDAGEDVVTAEAPDPPDLLAMAATLRSGA
ncbi:MAG: RluA family pseudouridine synthase [Myxococcales bacterium]|nr:RluA family pseudouridine synthase [Myxococcales bacterium]